VGCAVCCPEAYTVTGKKEKRARAFLSYVDGGGETRPKFEINGRGKFELCAGEGGKNSVPVFGRKGGKRGGFSLGGFVSEIEQRSPARWEKGEFAKPRGKGEKKKGEGGRKSVSRTSVGPCSMQRGKGGRKNQEFTSGKRGREESVMPGEEGGVGYQPSDIEKGGKGGRSSFVESFS